MTQTVAAPRQPSRDWRIALTTKAPYLAVDTPPAQLPDGFVPVGLELLCRHGSRTIAKLRTPQRMTELLRRAGSCAALTSAGQEVAHEFERLLVATESIGQGQLTDQGRAEMRGIARRMTHRLPSQLTSSAPGSAPKVEVLSASKQRTRDSADAFVDALFAGSDVEELPDVHLDDQLLYFHKSDERYRQYKSHDARLAAVLAAARSRQQTHDAARSLLGAVVAPTFVDELARGEHSDLAADDVDAATLLHALWQAIAAQDYPDDPSQLTRHLPMAALEWFGYLDDVDTFYEKGPAFAGDDVTFAMAGPLLEDMITSAKARFRGDRASTARLRFTHAEEILPVALLLQVPAAGRPVTAGETYSYESNPFRGAELSPMAANIQWEVYSNGATALVRMLINEQPSTFAAALRPFGPSRDLYELTEIEKYYARSNA